jgi:hypothetical protein
VIEEGSVWAKQQKLGEEVIGYAHGLKIEALYKLGHMLKATEPERNRGARGIGKSGVPPKYPTFSELGLDKKTSMVAQRLAALPSEHFEQVRQGASTITKASLASMPLQLLVPVRGTCRMRRQSRQEHGSGGLASPRQGMPSAQRPFTVRACSAEFF